MITRYVATSTLLVLIYVGVSATHAAEEQPPGWEIKGFVAALEDSHFDTVAYALLDDRSGLIFKSIGSGAGPPPEKTKPWVSSLSKWVVHEDPQIRAAAAQGLGLLGEHSRKHARALVMRLNDKVPHVRSAAVNALIELGEHAREQAPLLAKLVRYADWQLEPHELEALGFHAPHHPDQSRIILSRIPLISQPIDEVLQRY